MKFDDLLSDTKVFIDANIFIYHFTGSSEECSDFLNRCEQGDLIGITSINVLLEVLHRLMMIEAVTRNLIKPPNVAKKLKRHPEIIKQLKEYATNTQKISEMGIIITSFTYETILKSLAIRREYGLMINDSIIVAGMQEEVIDAIATNDEGFLDVDGISVYSPGDL